MNGLKSNLQNNRYESEHTISGGSDESTDTKYLHLGDKQNSMGLGYGKSPLDNDRSATASIQRNSNTTSNHTNMYRPSCNLLQQTNRSRKFLERGNTRMDLIMKSLFLLLVPISCFAGTPDFGVFDATQFNTNSYKITIKSGASLTNVSATNGFRGVDDAAYFGDASHNTIANVAAFPASTGNGQPLMTFSSSVGGDSAGQLFFSGSGGIWRRELQLGRVTIFETNAANGEGLMVKTTNGIDNCITLINFSTNHFDAMDWLDNNLTQQGAVGFGNSRAPFYVGNNFLEDNGNRNGFYFASAGFINGGLHRIDGSFIWYDGASGTNDLSANIVGLLTTAGNLSVKGIVTGTNGVTVGVNGGTAALLVNNTRWNSSITGQLQKLDYSVGDPNSVITATNVRAGIADGNGFSMGSGLGFGMTYGSAQGGTLNLNWGGGTALKLFSTAGGSEDVVFQQDTRLAVGSANQGSLGSAAARAGQIYSVTNNAIGFTTQNTNQFAVAATGWTNTNNFNCVVYITAATAATFTFSDGTNTIFTDTGLTFTTAETLILHPSYKIVVASGTITAVAVVQ